MSKAKSKLDVVVMNMALMTCLAVVLMLAS